MISVGTGKALELAIDRDALNQVVFNGEFVPGNQWVNPTNSYYQQAFPVPKRDLAKAKALLKAAGVDKLSFTGSTEVGKSLLRDMLGALRRAATHR